MRHGNICVCENKKFFNFFFSLKCFQLLIQYQEKNRNEQSKRIPCEGT